MQYRHKHDSKQHFKHCKENHTYIRPNLKGTEADMTQAFDTESCLNSACKCIGLS